MDDDQVLLARELPRQELERALRGGELDRLRYGAYRPTASTRDPGEHQSRARDATRTRAVDVARATHRQLDADHVFSHETAALLHGLRLWQWPTRTHLTQAYRRSGDAASDVARHRLVVPQEHRTTARGLPTTTLARTVADCARSLHPLESLVIADHALARGLDVDRSREALAITRRRNGVARARWVLDHADAGADSAWETWLRYVALRAGLPRPQTQAPVRTGRGTFRCDLGWPEHGVYAEFDGLIKYRDDGVRAGHDAHLELRREKARFDAIRDTGVNPVRVTAVGPSRVDEIARTLARRFPAEIRRTFRVNPLLPPPP